MESKGSRTPRVKGDTSLVSSVGLGMEDASTGFALDATGDLVRIVSRLTQDIERFDSMVSYHRNLIQQQGADLAGFNDKPLRRQTQLISARAAEIAIRAQSALDELHALSVTAEPLPPLSAQPLSESSRRHHS